MSMADLDGDGDLDIVINNLPARLNCWENRLCGGAAVEVDLVLAGERQHPRIGARVALRTSVGALHRDVRAASGYLSSDPPRLHFGFPQGRDPANPGDPSGRMGQSAKSATCPPTPC